MAAAEHPLERALVGVCACMGRPPIPPRSRAACVELLQSFFLWASPSAESGCGEEILARGSPAMRASLVLTEAVKAVSRGGGQVTGAGTAEEGPELKSQTAEESGKSNLVKGDVEKTGNKDVAPTPKVKALSAPVVLDAQCVLDCATAPLLLLCGVHIQEAAWSDPQARCLSNQLLLSLLDAAHCPSVTELLRGSPEEPYSPYRAALGLLGPRLRKDTWPSHPDASLVFPWLLFQVPRPFLSEYLSRVMPPSLLLSDDYKLKNKILGVRCLHHIVKNVPAAELRQYNRALVVYHALRNHLYSTEHDLIEVVLPCLLDLFPILHKPPPALGAYKKDAEDPADQVMQLLLTHMEMEHRINLRRLYARTLPAFQERLGVGIVRHLKRLLQVIVGYLEVYDGPAEAARLSILETLQGTIKYAWPRIPPRLPLLLKSLLKLIHELSTEANQNSPSITETLLKEATECLLLLDHCCKGQVKAALKDIPTVCNKPLLRKCIQKVLQGT
ncbi:hypothetical protein GDO81_009054 [Engystomops pustulosus]|uniref:TELO2-interacting protein 2 n=2 Tax=Engystomops pustulosus TaxID=76066 RepID=A0AAV7BNN9_ENGPU|nr:hypothetical protein GDO81_009054 [Engystomops pustulosus]